MKTKVNRWCFINIALFKVKLRPKGNITDRPLEEKGLQLQFETTLNCLTEEGQGQVSRFDFDPSSKTSPT